MTYFISLINWYSSFFYRCFKSRLVSSTLSHLLKPGCLFFLGATFYSRVFNMKRGDQFLCCRLRYRFLHVTYRYYYVLLSCFRSFFHSLLLILISFRVWFSTSSVGLGTALFLCFSFLFHSFMFFLLFFALILFSFRYNLPLRL